MIDVLKDNVVTIRKERRCFSCYRKFPEKTRMNYWVGVVDGDFNTLYACLTCVGIMNIDTETEIFKEGYVKEMLNEGETPEEMIERWETEFREI